jgi:VanZ family protein
MSGIFYLSSLEPAALPPASSIPHLAKVAHAGVFLVLLLAFHPPRRAGRVLSEWLPGSVVACAVFAVTDEIHQAWVPGRSPDVLDVTADATGILLGALLARGRWLQSLAYRILR